MTLTSRILGALAGLPPARTTGVCVDRDLPAKMADGVELLADRWYPNGAHCPVVLLRTPYGRRQFGMVGRLFAERGYQVVIQSCRGTFGSAGEFVPFRHEEADGRDTLGWITDQPWFEGRLVTFGPSYLGLTQWAVANDPPDFLKAIAPTVTASNFRVAVVFPSEVFALETGLTWIHQVAHQERDLKEVLTGQVRSRRSLQRAFGVLPVADADAAAVGHQVPFYQDWIVHEKLGDSWWDPVDFGQELGSVPPASLVGGWYDIFLPRQLDDYTALKAAGRSATLTIGPWSHVSPGVFAASLREGLRHFDEQLSSTDGWPRSNPVRLFVMGSKRWVELPDWPPPVDEQRWYLASGGSLRRAIAPDSSPDKFLFDPKNPTPGIGGASLNWGNAGPKDQRKRERRPDVLTYTSEPLTEDVTVIGRLTAELHVRSTLEHTDFFVRLCDVSDRGKSRNLSDGIVRLSPGKQAKSADGEISIRVEMWPTANTFKRGHRIRLQVSSCAHPLYNRNPGTGEALAIANELKSASQEIFHDPQRPSCILLPVTRLL